MPGKLKKAVKKAKKTVNKAIKTVGKKVTAGNKKNVNKMTTAMFKSLKKKG